MIDTLKTGKFVLPTNNELSYEFTDTAIKSTLKRMITTKEEEVFISMNRLTEEMIGKFSKKVNNVRQQMMLS